MKIHCAQLCGCGRRAAFRALEPQPGGESKPVAPTTAPTLLDSFSKPKEGGIKLTFLDEEK